MITTRRTERDSHAAANTPKLRASRRARARRRLLPTLAAGAGVAAAVSMTLPASAVAAPAPPPTPGVQGTLFQIPSIISGQCAPGFINLSYSNADYAPYGDLFPGKSVFKFDILAPSNDSAQVAGDVTFGWFNLTTFESGIVSAPFTTNGLYSSAYAYAQTGTGQVVAFAQPRGTATPKYAPGPETPCYFTPSIGVLTAS